MVDKRYQVFLSSTYEDLREERSAAILALLKMDCFPAGMELFPSSDDSVWQIIKKTIEESDYYVLIIAGRYGSISNDGVTSWTEREYDYAQEIGKPTFVFLYKNIDDITKGKIDNEEKVRAFREKVGERFCVTCNNIDALRADITLAIAKAIREKPGIGWIRADALCRSSAAHSQVGNSDTIEDERVVDVKKRFQILHSLHYTIYTYNERNEIAQQFRNRIHKNMGQIFYEIITNSNLYYSSVPANACLRIAMSMLDAEVNLRVQNMYKNNKISPFWKTQFEFDRNVIHIISKELLDTGVLNVYETGQETSWALSAFGRRFFDTCGKDLLKSSENA